MELIIIALGLVAFAYVAYLCGKKIGKERGKEERMRKLAEQHWESVVRVSLPEGSATSAEQLAATAGRQMNRAMRRNT